MWRSGSAHRVCDWRSGADAPGARLYTIKNFVYYPRIALPVVRAWATRHNEVREWLA